MRVLITGAGGFIGQHLVQDQLKRGRQVTAVDLNTAALAPFASDPHLSIVEGDFANRDLVDPHLMNQDICFHLAAAHLQTSTGEAHYWRVNVTDTVDFARRCDQAGVERFVLCSSVGVYGPLKSLPADEETTCQPDIVYEKSKLAGEREVLAYARETGFAVVVVRPAWVYGPNCPRTVKLIRTIQKKRFFFVGDGKTVRHPIYVDDMVEGFEAAATNPQAVGEIFIFAGPEIVTLVDLTAEIARNLEISPPKLRIPYRAVWTGCLFLEGVERMTGKDMPFSRRSLKFYTDSSAFTTDKAYQLLGFKAETPLSSGMVDTFAWVSGNEEVN